MKGYLLDTNIPSEMRRSRPEPRVIEWLKAANDHELYLSVITLGEIWKGFTLLRDANRRAQLEEWLERDVRDWFLDRILPVNEAVAERWGVLEGDRQLRGVPLNTADGLIAATALEHDLGLATRNSKDFLNLGVQIINPWEL
ncbi:MAG TPA: type II toxin-antitoxin system VapC family toxin [Candidatus Saccharimonadales bacterium]|jgi:predicted nucleic acid-binding protein|nr:type II toxin-antitoxin system VapC family toxin [Candidatus Saccharimonadales bacterium]